MTYEYLHVLNSVNFGKHTHLSVAHNMACSRLFELTDYISVVTTVYHLIKGFNHKQKNQETSKSLIRK